MKSQLILIRGVPGSGKSTIAGLLSDAILERGMDVVCLSADDYMTDPSGKYLFNRDRLPEVHEMCFEDTCVFLLKNYTAIIHNTFTRVWEMEKYLTFAANHKIPVSVIHLQGPWETTHGVPKARLEKFRADFEEFQL